MQFSMAIKCEHCDGNGTAESTVYSQDIMLMVLHNVEDGVVQKIPAIRQVRNEYGMGLKQAKDLVEGAMAFYTSIKETASQILTEEYPDDEEEWKDN